MKQLLKSSYVCHSCADKPKRALIAPWWHLSGMKILLKISVKNEVSTKHHTFTFIAKESEKIYELFSLVKN